jgi:hypothetical protein
MGGSDAALAQGVVALRAGHCVELSRQVARRLHLSTASRYRTAEDAEAALDALAPRAAVSQTATQGRYYMLQNLRNLRRLGRPQGRQGRGRCYEARNTTPAPYGSSNDPEGPVGFEACSTDSSPPLAISSPQDGGGDEGGGVVSRKEALWRERAVRPTRARSGRGCPLRTPRCAVELLLQTAPWQNSSDKAPHTPCRNRADVANTDEQG